MKNQEKLLMSKLRQPVHISYIAKNIFKVGEDEAEQILKQYVENGQIKESGDSKGYYVVSNQEI